MAAVVTIDTRPIDECAEALELQLAPLPAAPKLDEPIIEQSQKRVRVPGARLLVSLTGPVHSKYNVPLGPHCCYPAGCP